MCRAIYMCIINLFDEKLPLALKIIINRSIGTPGHGKYVIYGLNVIYKSYLREKMNSLS